MIHKLIKLAHNLEDIGEYKAAANINDSIKLLKSPAVKQEQDAIINKIEKLIVKLTGNLAYIYEKDDKFQSPYNTNSDSKVIRVIQYVIGDPENFAVLVDGFIENGYPLKCDGKFNCYYFAPGWYLQFVNNFIDQRIYLKFDDKYQKFKERIEEHIKDEEELRAAGKIKCKTCGEYANPGERHSPPWWMEKNLHTPEEEKSKVLSRFKGPYHQGATQKLLSLLNKYGYHKLSQKLAAASIELSEEQKQEILAKIESIIKPLIPKYKKEEFNYFEEDLSSSLEGLYKVQYNIPRYAKKSIQVLIDKFVDNGYPLQCDDIWKCSYFTEQWFLEIYPSKIIVEFPHISLIDKIKQDTNKNIHDIQKAQEAGKIRCKLCNKFVMPREKHNIQHTPDYGSMPHYPEAPHFDNEKDKIEYKCYMQNDSPYGGILIKNIYFPADETTVDPYPTIYSGEIRKQVNNRYTWRLYDDSLGAVLDGIKGPNGLPLEYNTVGQAEKALKSYHHAVVNRDRQRSNQELGAAQATGQTCSECNQPITNYGIESPNTDDWFCSPECFHTWQRRMGFVDFIP